MQEKSKQSILGCALSQSSQTVLKPTEQSFSSASTRRRELLSFLVCLLRNTFFQACFLSACLLEAAQLETLFFMLTIQILQVWKFQKVIQMMEMFQLSYENDNKAHLPATYTEPLPTFMLQPNGLKDLKLVNS